MYPKLDKWKIKMMMMMMIPCSQTFLYALKVVAFHVLVMAKGVRTSVVPHIVNHGTNEVIGESHDATA
jgi:hypothetical protein